MRVRISEPLSSFRRSLIPTLFSLTSQAAQAAQPSRLVPAGTDPRAAVFPETIGPSDQGTATSVPSSPPFWHRLQVFHYDLSSVNLSKGLFFFFYRTLIFRAVLALQKHYTENTEFPYTPSSPIPCTISPIINILH